MTALWGSLSLIPSRISSNHPSLCKLSTPKASKPNSTFEIGFRFVLAASFFGRPKGPKVKGLQSLRMAVAPSFENFCDQVLGSWKGWSSTVEEDALKSPSEESAQSHPSQVAFTECDTKVTAINRNCAACAGVAQGTNDWIRLDRDQKGFVYFDCGSWSADELQGNSLVVTTAIQIGDQRQVVACKIDGGDVREMRVAVQAFNQRGLSVRPPLPDLRRSPGFLQRFTFMEGIQGESRSTSFISTRLSWKNATKTIMDLWEEACEYDLPNGFLAVKPIEEGFWMLLVVEQGAAAKVIARKYVIDSTPEVVSVAMLKFEADLERTKAD